MPNPDDDTFFSRVYRLVRQIPPGRVTTYGMIAEMLGIRKSARMVGWALSSADLSDVPAHRVVNRYGALTGRLHFLTPETMREMLESEGVAFRDDGTVDLERHMYRFTSRSSS
ncbi:MGMT family protein [Prosthecochloris sp. N3]|uniref:MGMT family protein n=1 Tax=Prosthecochloris ethylica TaxID=2743976 RepID=A0ABR9XT77_9CHLB|nr:MULTISPECIES: MGMT family protein [Prosthecochloris]MEC9487753.1 MGMT family protein [Prosthecochloris sp.]MBF0587096.1 MGMT family protein [Prosthecochloris ethylica]MBF0637206.1 MGMT family protein [Prosthecochloris ethylica]NUK48249.1 MGMT family protein [Prosthecochloris ethylica]RNA65649.1 MGMT family protein [Prosthecochloris sp. ZM_2]